MEEFMLITDIYWERIYLHIKVDGGLPEGSRCELCAKDGTAVYPLSLDEKNGEIVVNITNVFEEKMLSSGDWWLMCVDGDGREHLIGVSSDVCLKCAQLDKVYWYGEGNYAYIFSIIPEYGDEVQTCIIRSAFMKPNRTPQRRYSGNKNAPVKKRIHDFLISFLGSCLNVLYHILAALLPKKGNRILLMSENRRMGGNLQALDERLKQRGLDKRFKISYHFAEVQENKGFRLLLVWLKLVFVCARQDFICIDDYEPFFEHVKLSGKTRLIQLWHAGVGFKSVGYSRFGMKGSCHPFASSHRRYDYAIVGGEALREVYSEVFGIDERKCLPFGLLRNDGYTDEKRINAFRESFYREYPGLRNKEIILFAPTFRGDGMRTAYYPFEIIDQKKIYELCGDDKVFVVKMHPFVSEKVRIEEAYASRILDFSFFNDINSLFYVTDVLITDYSSNIYEFAMLEKPVISFAFDKEAYEMQRSLHRTLEDNAPGKVCYSFEELLTALEERDYETDKLYKFIKENINTSEKYASDRVIDEIFMA